MTKRLFTFGCSYTKSFYPTWADFLGEEFNHYENWGVQGIGNRAIAERVAECHASKDINKDDIVIVQWSNYLRHDFYNPFPVLNRLEKWKTGGDINNPKNKKVYDETWMKKFFSEKAYIMHSLNYITLIQELLNSTRCTWYMTSIIDWKNLIQTKASELEFYVKPIWEDHKDHWLSNIDNNRWEWKDVILEDQCPSSRDHYNWLIKNVTPKLNIEIKDQTEFLKKLEQTKKLSRDERSKFSSHYPQYLSYQGL